MASFGKPPPRNHLYAECSRRGLEGWGEGEQEAVVCAPAAGGLMLRVGGEMPKKRAAVDPLSMGCGCCLDGGLLVEVKQLVWY